MQYVIIEVTWSLIVFTASRRVQAQAGRVLRLAIAAAIGVAVCLTTAPALTPAPAPYRIRFEPDSTNLVAADCSTLRDFANGQRQSTQSLILLCGFMDEEEAAGVLDVAWLRTQVVRNALITDGVDRERIIVRAVRPKPTDRSNWPKLTPAEGYADRRLAGGHAVEVHVLHTRAREPC